MQRAFIVVVLQVDASAEFDQVLQRPNVTLATRVMQRGAAGIVFFVQQLSQTLLTAILNDEILDYKLIINLLK